MSQLNPVPLTIAGATSPEGTIIAIQWTGATTAADTVVISHAGGEGEVFWECRAALAHTYERQTFPFGIPAKGGLIVDQISSGRVLVYYRLAS